jgi:hypothetical protein
MKLFGLKHNKWFSDQSLETKAKTEAIKIKIEENEIYLQKLRNEVEKNRSASALLSDHISNN